MNRVVGYLTKIILKTIGVNSLYFYIGAVNLAEKYLQ